MEKKFDPQSDKGRKEERNRLLRKKKSGGRCQLGNREICPCPQGQKKKNLWLFLLRQRGKKWKKSGGLLRIQQEKRKLRILCWTTSTREKKVIMYLEGKEKGNHRTGKAEKRVVAFGGTGSSLQM